MVLVVCAVMNDLDICLLNVSLSARLGVCVSSQAYCSCRRVRGNEVRWVVTKCSTEHNKAICLSKGASFWAVWDVIVVEAACRVRLSLSAPVLHQAHAVCSKR